ncbi:hypothetical protein K0M31_011835 [Melipona bicolor]|uniref:Uncharacterized protein n=1 Tax=Melipona bicolor TaxID=60889 RepID=A0AA40GAB8_9HYME|nr:hypothetical protein K0M31_011835 [Melipona bicolor]
MSNCNLELSKCITLVHRTVRKFSRNAANCVTSRPRQIGNESHVGSRAGTARPVTIMTMDDNDGGGQISLAEEFLKARLCAGRPAFLTESEGPAQRGALMNGFLRVEPLNSRVTPIPGARVRNAGQISWRTTLAKLPGCPAKETFS